ncbi:hypothetical protein Zmor_008140 [Zophobas morio]|uniref:Ig-like domain-containing protein n=1 Tax=Zophobas morio TaxID=2755281 RepID=A0AA38MQF5_9CUCU|nr:hypothetical protein Zmor_008140 [Zophobas morio]
MEYEVLLSPVQLKASRRRSHIESFLHSTSVSQEDEVPLASRTMPYLVLFSCALFSPFPLSLRDINQKYGTTTLIAGLGGPCRVPKFQTEQLCELFLTPSIYAIKRKKRSPNSRQLEFHNRALKLFERLKALYETARLPPDPPEITMKPRNLQVKAGGIAAFYCAARGDPLPVIQWKKNGKRVSGSQTRYQVKEFPDGGSLLRIEPVKAGRDDANYECVAENGVGDAVNADATLVVFEGKVRFISRTRSSRLLSVTIVPLFTATINKHFSVVDAVDIAHLYIPEAPAVISLLGSEFRLVSGDSSFGVVFFSHRRPPGR